MFMSSRSLVPVALCLAACSGVIEDGRAVPGVAGSPAPWLSGASGTAGSAPGAATTPQSTTAVTLPAATLRRLTSSQYQNSVRDLLGVEADVSMLTAIPRLSGLRAIGASTMTLPERDTELLETLSDRVSAQAWSDANARTKRLGCEPTQAACKSQFVRSFGRRAFRLPLNSDEQRRYEALLTRATEMSGDVWLGLRVVTGAFLQSPAFLYREELGTPDASQRVLTPFELAARLSFFIWDTTPDEALLDAAESGKLGSATGLTSEAQRLLASPRASVAADALISDYLGLEALDALVKLPEAYPAATATLAAAAKEETLRSLRAHLFERGDDFRDVFTSTKTFVNAELAALYEVRAPSGADFVEVDLGPTGPRAGLLMQASFLAIHSHPSRSSPTLRGKFIRENLLCQAIPPPPNNVDTSLPANTRDAMTARQRLTAHREDPSCATCHVLMDPLGLALEQFDGVGAFRERENNLAIDASGELDGKTFTDARGLAATLAQDANTASCFVRIVLRYARGALEHHSETVGVEALHRAFADAGYRATDLMLAIATDPAFRRVGALQ
jgi:hypothetical protein